MKYFPLHVHSDFSLLDGLSKPEQIAERLEKLELEGSALTDHGNVSGAVDFVKELTNKKQKPILGCELYICKDNAHEKTPENAKLCHQVILAKNLKGWKNLIELVSKSHHPDRHYYKPRLDLLAIAETAIQKNFITFSGHLGSLVANAMIENEEVVADWKKRGIQQAKHLQHIFGKENFYLEVQLIDSEQNELARKVAEMVREISLATSIPCVATPDAHYPAPEDADDQRVLLCAAVKKSLKEIIQDIKNGKSKAMSTFLKSNAYHIPSYETMKRFHTDEELENTLEIAGRCENYNILSKPLLPSFKCPEGHTPDTYLRHLCRQGYSNLLKPNVRKEDEIFKTYGERVKYELSVLQEAGLSSYFLIVTDICKYVKDNNWLLGPGRGSAAGCMISYLLGITSINPIKHDLVFERFYNAGRNTKDRVALPDIDVDVPKDAREEVIKYIKNRYGEQNVAQIITFQTIKGRGALKRVFATYDQIPFSEQNLITKEVFDESKIADELQDMKEELGISSIIRWALENRSEKFKNWVTLNKDGSLEGPLSKNFEQAIRLEGTKIAQGLHPAGVVISPVPLFEICPLTIDRNGKNLVAALEGPACEDIGLAKYDILGITMLTKAAGTAKILLEGNLYD